MLNVEWWIWMLKCWMLKVETQHFNISTSWNGQHFNVDNICGFSDRRATFNIEKNELLTTLSTFVQIYTTLDVENLNMLKCWKCWKVERLKCWNVEMLKLKCWFLYYKPQHFNISTLEFLNISTFQLFNISTFQHSTFSTFQHFNVEETKSNSQSVNRTYR